VLLTVDTCVLIALLNWEIEHDPVSIEALLQAARDNRVDLQVTAAFDRDRLRSRDQRGAELLEWVRTQPVLSVRAGGAFRSDVSVLDGPDLLADEATGALARRIQEVLRIKQLDARKPDKVFSDADHLLAHHLSGADAFVTVDDRTILSHRVELAKLGLLVLTPREALAYP
jgi:hypothetical protein